MTQDLMYLAFTAAFTAALWIPYIVSQLMTNGPLQPENYTDPTWRKVPLWGLRAHRVYLNALENFAPFAALVIVAHLIGKADSVVIFCAASYFWLRVIHAIVYWFGISFMRIRTVVFTLGFFCVLGIFIEIIR